MIWRLLASATTPLQGKDFHSRSFLSPSPNIVNTSKTSTKGKISSITLWLMINHWFIEHKFMMYHPGTLSSFYLNFLIFCWFSVMRMWETGLITFWEKRTIPIPTACLNIKQRPKDNPRLNMRNLSGPFVILLIGYGISVFFFFAELIWQRFCPIAAKRF